VISRSRVYLMPQATTEQELRNKSSWLAEECKNYGYNFTTRLQVILWGRQRGV
jgi:7-carboxy-7-deazaguanine synthase